MIDFDDDAWRPRDLIDVAIYGVIGLAIAGAGSLLGFLTVALWGTAVGQLLVLILALLCGAYVLASFRQRCRDMVAEREDERQRRRDAAEQRVHRTLRAERTRTTTWCRPTVIHTLDAGTVVDLYSRRNGR